MKSADKPVDGALLPPAADVDAGWDVAQEQRKFETHRHSVSEQDDPVLEVRVCEPKPTLLCEAEPWRERRGRLHSATDTLRPSEQLIVRPPDSPRRRKRDVTSVGITLGLLAIVGAIVLHRRSVQSAVEAESARANATTQVSAVAQPLPAAPMPSAPTPVTEPSPVTPTVEQAIQSAPRRVKVRVVPEKAVFLEHGARIGRGEVTLELAADQTRTLSTRYPGYEPMRLTIDGQRQNITVFLRKARNPEYTLAE